MELELSKRHKFFLEVFGVCIGAAIVFGNFVTLAIVLVFFVIWMIIEFTWSLRNLIISWKEKRTSRRRLRGE